ncbi:MAG: glycosyltransferase [Oscillospiraceae bacterium]|nr:glycosyltransferase [Oscillospiraceae bacterium]
MAQISVIVPVYRAEKFLNRCVDSILAQTFEDLEVILVDDGSPDTSGQICDDYAARDSRVHVIHQENAGVCVARNVSLDWVFANSESQWIFFIDNDDWMHPETLKRMHQAALEHRSNLVICGYGQTGGEDPVIEEAQLKSRKWKPKDFYMQHFVNATVCWGKLYHRSCFDGLRYPPGKYIEDEFLTYRLLFAQETLTVIPAPLYAYYYNESGISKMRWTPKRLDSWEAYEQQIAWFEKLGDRELVRFRVRNYVDMLLPYFQAAREADAQKELEIIRKKGRSLLRWAWKQGFLDFWCDFETLSAFYPVWTKAYRFYIDKCKK